MLSTERIIAQIDSVLAEWTTLRGKSRNKDSSDQPESDAVRVTNLLASTIDRFSPMGSQHKRLLEKEMNQRGHPYIHLEPLAGALQALRQEYELGHMQSVTELVHADTFADFLEMADHLLGQGYKDAAAVIVGSVLEQHLRELAMKSGIGVSVGTKLKKADTLNADLAGQSVYSKLDQKSVTSWLGLRNDAAHGNYGNYTADQVALMLSAVRDFISRHPA